MPWQSSRVGQKLAASGEWGRCLDEKKQENANQRKEIAERNSNSNQFQFQSLIAKKETTERKTLSESDETGETFVVCRAISLRSLLVISRYLK
jgi:hypothetical protein